MARCKISYDIEDTLDVFTAPTTWPEPFIKDPAYALFRPLYEHTSPWRASYGSLLKYLNGQARRLGGRQYVLIHLAKLAQITPRMEFIHLHAFLTDPFTPKHHIPFLFLDVDRFLHWRFKSFADPWQDLDTNEPTNTEKPELPSVAAKDEPLSDATRKKILKQALSKVPWQQQFQRALEYESGVAGYHSELIENALKECPDLKSNQGRVQSIFASPATNLEIEIGECGYAVCELPVMLGSHFLSKKAQKTWFDAKDKKFYKILGCYARWDNAQIVIFKQTTMANQRRIFDEIRAKHALISVGVWKKAQVDGLDYYLSLLIDADIPDKAFFVSEWEINCPNLLIKGY